MCREQQHLHSGSYTNSTYPVNIKSVEAVVQRCSVKKVFLEVSQNSQENTCARDFF